MHTRPDMEKDHVSMCDVCYYFCENEKWAKGSKVYALSDKIWVDMEMKCQGLVIFIFKTF
jgi:hypothetical protein